MKDNGAANTTIREFEPFPKSGIRNI